MTEKQKKTLLVKKVTSLTVFFIFSMKLVSLVVGALEKKKQI